MSTVVTDLKAQHADAIAKADGIVAMAERQKRPLTSSETTALNNSLAEADRLKAQMGNANADTITRAKEMLAQFPRTRMQMRFEGGEPVLHAGDRLHLLVCQPASLARPYPGADENKAAASREQ